MRLIYMSSAWLLTHWTVMTINFGISTMDCDKDNKCCDCDEDNKFWYITVIMTINFGILTQWTVIMSINYLTVIMTQICCGTSCVINYLIVAVKIFVCVVGCSSLEGKCLTERCILFNSHEKFSEPLLCLIFSTMFKPCMVIGCFVFKV